MPTREVFVTTEDNPYDYFTQFDEWYAFDEAKGYCTCEYFARLAHYSDFFTEEERLIETERVVDEILDFNLLGIYKKVERKIEENN